MIELDAATGLPAVEVKVGDSLVDVLIKLGFARSKREARYFITSGAVRLRKLNMEASHETQAET